MFPLQLALAELQDRFNESNYSKDLPVPGFTHRFLTQHKYEKDQACFGGFPCDLTLGNETCRQRSVSGIRLKCSLHNCYQIL